MEELKEVMISFLIGYMAGAASLAVAWYFYRVKINAEIQRLKDAAKLVSGKS